MIKPFTDGLIWGAEFGNNNQRTFIESAEANKWHRISGMAACKGTRANYLYVSYCRTNPNTYDVTGMVCQTKCPIQVNLTQMFGAGNEPATPEEFEHLCAINGVDLTKPQAYDEGTERSWIIN